MALRDAAMLMNNSALVIWHGKQAYGMNDKIDQNIRCNAPVLIVTGVPQAQIESNTPVIEHDSGVHDAD